MSGPDPKRGNLDDAGMAFDPDPDLYFYDDEEDADEDGIAEMNCGELPEGGCSLAGTEWCDWSCPFSDEMMKRAKRRR